MSELWRRLPSPWLVLSIELAFAARRMHARTSAVSNASKCSFCLQSDFGLADNLEVLKWHYVAFFLIAA